MVTTNTANRLTLNPIGGLVNASADLMRSLTGGADDESEHTLPGIYLGKVTRATASEVHFVIEEFSHKLEFGPAPYPRPGGETEADGGHDHEASTSNAGDHDHPGVVMGGHNHGPAEPVQSAGTPDVESAGLHTHEIDVESVTDHTHELAPGQPPEGTQIAVAFAEGDPDRPLVLATYGWPA